MASRLVYIISQFHFMMSIITLHHLLKIITLLGQPLGNDRESWSDELLGGIPNIYVYAANNPSESILAKRRAYATLVSYNVPPYGRAGLYLELANLRDLISEYRTSGSEGLRQPIWSACQRCGVDNEVPLFLNEGEREDRFLDLELPESLPLEIFDAWIKNVSNYLDILQERLFSSGLHVLGSKPSNDDLKSYLSAYFDDALTEQDYEEIFDSMEDGGRHVWHLPNFFINFANSFGLHIGSQEAETTRTNKDIELAKEIVSLISRNTEELDSIMSLLDGGYIAPAPGGDLLRDGKGVLPTGRNIHALDPYRMPAAGAWIRGRFFKEGISDNYFVTNTYVSKNPM